MNYRLFIIIFLGAFFGFGPFLTDMYLPAFPQLYECYATSASIGICTYVFGCVVTPLVELGNTMHATAIIYFISTMFTLYFARKGVEKE